MNYHVERYGTALVVHKKWWWLLLPLFLLYGIWAANSDVEYTIVQTLSPFSEGMPVAAVNSPRDIVKLSEIVNNPDLLFLDGFALTKLIEKLILLQDQSSMMDEKNLRYLVHKDLSLTLVDGTSLQLAYTGRNAPLGAILVAFYTERLMSRVEDGLVRAKNSPLQLVPALKPVGEPAVKSQIYYWRSDRVKPAALVLLLSSLGIMVLIVIFELLDPTFKSERQMARYLGVPILGTMPDAGPLAKLLNRDSLPGTKTGTA